MTMLVERSESSAEPSRARSQRETETVQFAQAALASAKQEGLQLAVRARYVALAIIACLLPAINPAWEQLYYVALLGLFALIGWAQVRVGRVGVSRSELALLFCDLALLTFVIVVPNPFGTTHWPVASSSRNGRTLPGMPAPSPAANQRHSSPSGEINGTASGKAIARPRSATRVPAGSVMARAEACEMVTLGVARSWRAVHQATPAPSAATSARMARAAGERATSAEPCAADHTKNATPMTGAAPIINRHFISCVVPDIAPLPVLAYPGSVRRDAVAMRTPAIRS